MTEPTLDDHLDALGTGLEQRRVRADRRRRQRLAGTGVGVAAVAIGLGALVAVPGGRQLDPVAQARAALDLQGALLHYEVSFQSVPPTGSKMPTPNRNAIGTAVWTTTTGPERYRTKTPADGRPMYCGSSVILDGRTGKLTGPSLVAPTEYAVDDETATLYSPFSRAAIIRPQPRPKGTSARATSSGFLLTQLPGDTDPRDPVRVIRDALSDGHLRDSGTVVQDGRRLRRLTGTLPLDRRETRPTKLSYLVDASSYAPVELRSTRWSIWSKAGGRDHWKWLTTVEFFKQFERLPDTPQNAALLNIDLPADTVEIHLDGHGHTSPRQLPKRLVWAGGHVDRAAQQRCKAALRPSP